MPLSFLSSVISFFSPSLHLSFSNAKVLDFFSFSLSLSSPSFYLCPLSLLQCPGEFQASLICCIRTRLSENCKLFFFSISLSLLFFLSIKVQGIFKQALINAELFEEV